MVSVSAAVSAGIRDWTAIVTATAIVATTPVGRAIVTAVVTAVNANVGIVRIRGRDVRIGIGCWVAVARRVGSDGRCNVAADSETDSTDSHADNNPLGKQAATSQ